MAKTLFIFLVRHQALELFVENYYNYHQEYGYDDAEDINLYFSRDDAASYISLAFSWANTPQKAPFWGALDTEWRNAVKSIRGVKNV